MSVHIKQLHENIKKHIHHKVKHHVHKHFHKNVHHVSHAIAHHLDTLHMSIVAVALSLTFLGTSMMAWSTLNNIQTNTSLDYPLKKVTTFACRQQMKPWSELPDSCKINLPIIQWANYDKYSDNPEYKNIYTVLRGATYWWQRDMDKWDHAGVDIASASGTPLYSVAHGIVTFAGTQEWYGNVVKIMFRYKDVTYHAVYWHMNSISVSKWDIVAKWQLIWELWNSGSTFWALWGNHVHFEIDKDNAGRPAFYYQGCPALATNTFTQITNGWLCREYREKYSFDPIAFIEASKSVDVAVDIHPVAPVEDTKDDIPVVDNSVDTKQTLQSQFLVLNSLKPQKLTSAGIEFIKNYDIQLVAYANTKMNLWQKGTITVYITKKWTAQNMEWTLPVELTFVSPNAGVTLSQQSLQYIAQGKQTIDFTTRKLGKTTIAISLWWQTLAVLPLEVIK